MHSRSRPLLYAKNEAEAKRRRENSERDACYVELDHVARKLRKTESALAESKRVRRAHGVRSSLKPSMSRALSKPKTWLMSWGPTSPSARRHAVPTTEPNARLKLPCSLGPPGRGDSTEP